MAIAMQKEEMLERRGGTLVGFDDLWERLTLAQKFAASSLTQFGYKLNFIRDVDDTNLAILCCNENIVAISKAGEINTQPNIHIRS
ncbi:hypothetical protein [Colwellia echini]|uniref:Uncharacterized protein n=1 Tax=Colwellia echini TaxID=1982103 RepID=A0ABY3MU20_9GAMM|nr:hypothetical protein [Colwellia echini]TYK64680.1 hypothetical protein CWS31_014610 [Colwellia echini]